VNADSPSYGGVTGLSLEVAALGISIRASDAITPGSSAYRTCPIDAALIGHWPVVLLMRCHSGG
jgi:hypothetical protein